MNLILKQHTTIINEVAYLIEVNVDSLATLITTVSTSTTCSGNNFRSMVRQNSNVLTFQQAKNYVNFNSKYCPRGVF